MEDKELLVKTFRSSADFLHELRQVIRQTCQQGRASGKCIDDLALAASEAFANIIKHGYGEGNEGEVLVRISHNDEEMRITLQDKAPAVDLRNMRGRDPDEIRPGGLGLYFIRQLMDRVEYPRPADGEGNIIVLVKKKKTRVGE